MTQGSFLSGKELWIPEWPRAGWEAFLCPDGLWEAAGVGAEVKASARHWQNRKLMFEFSEPSFLCERAAVTHFNLHVNELLLKTITKSIILFYSIYGSRHLSNLPLTRMEFKITNKPVLNLLFEWVDHNHRILGLLFTTSTEKWDRNVGKYSLGSLPGREHVSSEPIPCPSHTPSPLSHCSTPLL